MNIRRATASDLPILNHYLRESGQEQVSLTSCLCWVAESDSGELVGMLPIRMVWQAEPLLVFPNVKQFMTRRRVARYLGRAVCDWIADRSKNLTGIYSLFAVTRGNAQARWFEKFKFSRIYTDCQIFAKDFYLERPNGKQIGRPQDTASRLDGLASD